MHTEDTVMIVWRTVVDHLPAARNQTAGIV